MIDPRFVTGLKLFAISPFLISLNNNYSLSNINYVSIFLVDRDLQVCVELMLYLWYWRSRHEMRYSGGNREVYVALYRAILYNIVI